MCQLPVYHTAQEHIVGILSGLSRHTSSTIGTPSKPECNVTSLRTLPHIVLSQPCFMRTHSHTFALSCPTSRCRSSSHQYHISKFNPARPKYVAESKFTAQVMSSSICITPLISQISYLIVPTGRSQYQHSYVHVPVHVLPYI